MTQGAGQGPEVLRTETLRDFRVPAYVHETGPYVPSTPPGEPLGAVDGLAEEPDGYTPTQRDLPIINRGDTVQVAVGPEAARLRSRPRARGRCTSSATYTAISTS